jgi:hypothetical protein
MRTLERCTRGKDGVGACHWQEHNFVQILKILGRAQQGNPPTSKVMGPVPPRNVAAPLGWAAA